MLVTQPGSLGASGDPHPFPARRLSKLTGAPFVKVEATKYTEVGYVGKDVESIIRDLVDTSVKMTREQAVARVRSRAEDAAYDRVVDCLLPRPQSTPGIGFANEPPAESRDDERTRQKIRYKVVHGEMDDKEIEFDVSANLGVEIMTPPGMEEMASQLQGMFQNLGGSKTQKRKMRVRDAMPLLVEEESARLINDEEIKQQALEAAQHLVEPIEDPLVSGQRPHPPERLGAQRVEHLEDLDVGGKLARRVAPAAGEQLTEEGFTDV